MGERIWMVWEPDGKCGLKIEEIKSSQHHVYGVIGNKENSIIGNIENSKIENRKYYQIIFHKMAKLTSTNFYLFLFVSLCLFV